MCGIATISIGRGRRGRIPYNKLQGLTQKILVELSDRGQDASGIAVVGDDHCFVFKKPLRPDRLVVRPRFREILEKIGPETNFIMLHSRAASVGGNEDNFNNHPIVADPVIGIHNGTLYNTEKLRKKFSDRFSTAGNVDSEILFRMFNMYLEEGLTPKQALCKVTEQLSGAFTGAALDLRHTHRMLMFKFQRDLAVLQLSHYDILVAVSKPYHYDRARDTMGLSVKDKLSYPKEATAFSIDLNDGPVTEQSDTFPIPVKKEEYWKDEYKQWAYFG